MKMKRNTKLYVSLFVIFILCAGYISFWNVLANNPLPVIQEGGVRAPGMLSAQMSHSATVSVTHNYFGLFTLPKYINGIGNLGSIHSAFFGIMVLLSVFVTYRYKKFEVDINERTKKQNVNTANSSTGRSISSGPIFYDRSTKY